MGPPWGAEGGSVTRLRVLGLKGGSGVRERREVGTLRTPHPLPRVPAPGYLCPPPLIGVWPGHTALWLFPAPQGPEGEERELEQPWGGCT